MKIIIGYFDVITYGVFKYLQNFDTELIIILKENKNCKNTIEERADVLREFIFVKEVLIEKDISLPEYLENEVKEMVRK